MRTRSTWENTRRVLGVVLVGSLAVGSTASPAARNEPVRAYFDPHNHITGILPAEAFANLPKFIEGFSNPNAHIDEADLKKLHDVLQKWYEEKGKQLGDQLYTPSPEQRYGLGGRAALVVYKEAKTKDQLRGLIERVLTSTPWTEFDSAYKFRGDPVEGSLQPGPVEAYLVDEHYGGDPKRTAEELCKATILQLARTGIGLSEQSMNFLGGWKVQPNGSSARLDAIRCYMNRPGSYPIQQAIEAMKQDTPTVKFLLMTHTMQLATETASTYMDYSRTGDCESTPLPSQAIVTPDTIRQGLLGLDDQDSPLVGPGERRAFYDAVVGIDTAGAETTCFSPAGMAFYKRLVKAVYDAARQRRSQDWHGKLLVHTHAGEGMNVYYAPKSLPVKDWNFEEAFGRGLPSVIPGSVHARDNIGAVLQAISDIRKDTAQFPDLDKYLVFRLGHVTNLTPEQAVLLSELGVEADVNLDSNVATGAYPLSSMPWGKEKILELLKKDIEDPLRNLLVNPLPRVLVPDPPQADRVAGILGNVSLKYLLESRARVMLGTDGGGIEHSDIARAYTMAGLLIEHWKQDPRFKEKAGLVSEKTLLDNVDWHIRNMGSDEPMPPTASSARRPAR
jgi:hypothetical protein